MISREAIDQALALGVPREEIFQLVTSPALRALIEMQLLELGASILNLDYKDNDALARAYRDKQRQYREIHDFQTYREELIRSYQEPTE